MTALSIVAAAPALASPPARVFVSGHSLVDQPLPGDLAAIAASLGTPIQWNRQYLAGSSIEARTRGRNPQGWQGYREGVDRDGQGLDVLGELARPAKVGGGAYDALLITEEHHLLTTLASSDTVRLLRHYHERFIAANPAGRTWFFQPWLGLDDRSDPRRWIAYERAASPVWQCIATRINVSLAAAGRPDRIEALGANLALASLVERATQGPGIDGVSADSVPATLQRLFSDDVHLTPLGSYYMALVTYAALFDRSPQGAWAPAAVPERSAAALQALAWDAVRAERTAREMLSLEQCRERLQSSFIALYTGYLRDTLFRRELGSLRAWLRWANHRVRWHWRARRDNPDQPFRYDVATDKDYWLPAP
jgi:hypothetical protein